MYTVVLIREAEKCDFHGGLNRQTKSFAPTVKLNLEINFVFGTLQNSRLAETKGRLLGLLLRRCMAPKNRIL